MRRGPRAIACTGCTPSDPCDPARAPARARDAQFAQTGSSRLVRHARWITIASVAVVVVAAEARSPRGAARSYRSRSTRLPMSANSTRSNVLRQQRQNQDSTGVRGRSDPSRNISVVSSMGKVASRSYAAVARQHAGALTTFVFGRHGGRSSRRRTSNGARRHSCRGVRRHRLERPPASRTASASSTARVRRACRCRRIQRAPTFSDNNDKTNPRPVFVVAPIQVETSRSSHLSGAT